MVFVLLIPLIHISIKVDNLDELETPIQQIGKFRTSYENLIALLDPNYETTEYQTTNKAYFEDNTYLDIDYSDYHQSHPQNANLDKIHRNKIKKAESDTRNLIDLILLVYFAGVLFFVVRLMLLFIWLYKTIKNNPVKEKKGFKIVLLQGDVPPFSFFRYVFVNQNAITEADLQQILAHEKVHIRQNHSIDLLLAHGISVLQWFNPFAWFFQKSIKTTHEYIADRKVVDQGFELIDYQSLLLSQLISIRSVELVNNFNLISIKKRIAMMTKKQSGFRSKLKALLIIPFALILFFVFTDMTIKGPGKMLANYYDREILDNEVQLDGLWKSKHIDSQEKFLFFNGDKISVLETGNQLREYQYEFKDNKLFIGTDYSKAIPLKYKKSGDQLFIWWNEFEFTQFFKTTHSNTLDNQLEALDFKISVPEISQIRILEREKLCINIFMNNEKIRIENHEVKANDIQRLIKKEKSTFRALDLQLVTVKLFVDKATPMKKVNKLQQILRHEGLFKIAYVGRENTNKIHALLTHAAALLQKLPPMNAKLVDEKKLQKSGLKIYSLDITKANSSPTKTEAELTKFIRNSDKYLMVLNFNDNTKFVNYLAHINVLYQTIYDFRNKKALQLYKLSFNDLPAVQQKMIRKTYPISLTQKNLSAK